VPGEARTCWRKRRSSGDNCLGTLLGAQARAALPNLRFATKTGHPFRVRGPFEGRLMEDRTVPDQGLLPRLTGCLDPDPRPDVSATGICATKVGGS
jgi:hypothetical protein